ncbi:unnamed protein product [Effrenium voratum]|nr:unnamed protein product [Effrenium voratum]
MAFCGMAGHRAQRGLLLLLPLSLCQAALFDLDLGGVTRLPLWEPTLEEYFPDRSAGELGLASPVVLTSPTREEFLFHARRGYPIVIADWAEGMKYTGWSCQDFADAFPFGYMKAEYIDDLPGFKRSQHDTKVIDGEMRFKLGSFKPDGKTWWYNFSRPASKRYKDDPLKPKQGPYVWHVKDELSPKEKKIVQQRFESPSFLQDPLNRAKMNRSFEVWFSPGAYSGAGAHNDGYCESVVSLQLRGDKRWRKMMLPKMSFLDSFDEFDGGVYDAGKWDPDLAFLNSARGAVIWPPGYLHETSTLPPPDGKCGSALTLQYAFPQPVQFLRAFLPRLSLSAEVGHCVGMQWSGYATMEVKGIGPTAKEQKMKEQLRKILELVDTDQDGEITVEETKAWFADSRSLALQRLPDPEFVKHKDLLIAYKAEDTVAYHDMNDDGKVSRQELWDSLVQWNVVRVRVQEGLKLLNRGDRKGLEALERSLDYLRREPLKLPKKVRPEMQDIFQHAKGSKLFRSLNGITSISDSEFWSPARDALEDLRRRKEL